MKAVKCIKLVGYAIANQSNYGSHQQHERTNDEYFVLNIDGVQGRVRSNNAYAHNAFCVLYTNTDFGDDQAATRYERFDQHGIVTHYLHNGDSRLRSLKVRVTDRYGRPANAGRMHLWFKVLTAYS